MPTPPCTTARRPGTAAWNSSRNRSARAPPSTCQWRRICARRWSAASSRCIYQPRLALEGMRVEAVEALLRWWHPQRGFVPPDEFIPLAEQSGLIVEIGDWVLREACAQARRWRDAGEYPWQVAVNVSGVQFRDGSLPERVSRRHRCRRHRAAHDRAGIHRGRADRIFRRRQQGGQSAEGTRRRHRVG